MAEFAEIAVHWPYARPAITFPGGQDTMTHKIHNPTVFQTSVRDLQEAAHVTTIPNFNLTQIGATLVRPNLCDFVKKFGTFLSQSETQFLNIFLPERV